MFPAQLPNFYYSIKDELLDFTNAIRMLYCSSFLPQAWHKFSWIILRRAMEEIICMMKKKKQKKKRGERREEQPTSSLTLHYPSAESLSCLLWTVSLEQMFNAAVSNVTLIHSALMATAIITERLFYLLYFKHQPSRLFTFPWRSLSNLRSDEILLLRQKHS